MKIRILQQREPFEELLQQTLQRYAESLGDRDVEIDWQERPWWSRWSRYHRNAWLCNPDLNVIFSPMVDPEALRPTIREFSRSLRYWRRWAQRRWVTAALSPATAGWFAPSQLVLSSRCIQPERHVIIPGNQKIRIMSHREGRCVCIRKQGFPDDAWQRELTHRATASDIGIRVPAILECHEQDGWYAETYVETSPLNRLVSPSDQAAAARDAWQQLQPLLTSTQESIRLIDYVSDLMHRIEMDLKNDNGWPADSRATTLRHATALAEWTLDAHHEIEITTSVTHGDFQPANIVINEMGVWIIDWERGDRRQTNYDLWVLTTQSRFPNGWIDRLCKTCQGEDDPWRLKDAFREATSAVPVALPHQAGLFLLEELAWRLEELNVPMFRHRAEWIGPFLHEFAQWRRFCA